MTGNAPHPPARRPGASANGAAGSANGQALRPTTSYSEAMWRSLVLIGLVSLLAGQADAARGALVGAWETCSGTEAPGAPALSACRPLHGVIDPQGRELWLRAPVRAKTA